MKKLVVLTVLGALVLSGVVAWLLPRRGRPEIPIGLRDPGRNGPPLVPVLCGSKNGLEVLVKARFQLEEETDFTDRALIRALGITGGDFTFLQVIVVNGTSAPVTIDPAALELIAASGAALELRGLRSLAGDAGAARAVLETHAPRVEVPLPPRHLRRFLVAAPQGTDVRGLVGGAMADVPLAPAKVGSRKLEEWLESRRPVAPMLVAVLDGVPESPPAHDGQGGNGR